MAVERLTIRADQVVPGDLWCGRTVVKIVPAFHFYDGLGSVITCHRCDETMDVERPVPSVSVELPLNLAQRISEGNWLGPDMKQAAAIVSAALEANQ